MDGLYRGILKIKKEIRYTEVAADLRQQLNFTQDI